MFFGFDFISFRMLRVAILLSAALLTSAFLPAKIAYRPTHVRLFDSSSSLMLKEKISAFKSCSNASRTDINEMVLQVFSSLHLTYFLDRPLMNVAGEEQPNLISCELEASQRSLDPGLFWLRYPRAPDIPGTRHLVPCYSTTRLNRSEGA